MSRWNTRTRYHFKADAQERRISIVRDFLGTYFADVSLFEAAIQDALPLLAEEDVDVDFPAQRVLDSILSDAIMTSRAKASVHDRFAYFFQDPVLSHLTFRDVLSLWFNCYFYGVHYAEGGAFPAFYGKMSESSLPPESAVVRYRGLQHNAIRIGKLDVIDKDGKECLSRISSYLPALIGKDEFVFFYHATSWSGASYFLLNGPRGRSKMQDFGREPKFYMSITLDDALSWGYRLYDPELCIIVYQVPKTEWDALKQTTNQTFSYVTLDRWNSFVTHCRNHHQPFCECNENIALEDVPILYGDMYSNPEITPHHPHKFQVALSPNDPFFSTRPTTIFHFD
jgi:hypothetical protein